MRLLGNLPVTAGILLVLVAVLASACVDNTYNGDDLFVEHVSDYHKSVILDQTVTGGEPVRGEWHPAPTASATTFGCEVVRLYRARVIDSDGNMGLTSSITPEGREVDQRTWYDIECPAKYRLLLSSNGRLDFRLVLDGGYDY